MTALFLMYLLGAILGFTFGFAGGFNYAYQAARAEYARAFRCFPEGQR